MNYDPGLGWARTQSNKGTYLCYVIFSVTTVYVFFLYFATYISNTEIRFTSFGPLQRMGINQIRSIFSPIYPFRQNLQYNLFPSIKYWICSNYLNIIINIEEGSHARVDGGVKPEYCHLNWGTSDILIY